MRINLLLSLLIFCSLIALPVCALQFSLFEGSVKYSDSLSTGEATVQAIFAGQSYTFTADADGVFSGAVPVGQVTFIFGVTRKIMTVQPGLVNKVQLTSVRPGWVVRFQYPDKTPASVKQVIAGYKLPGDSTAQPVRKIPTTSRIGEHNNALREIALGNNACWFPQVPANIATFLVVASYQVGNTTSAYRQQWTFTSAQSQRLLTAQLPATTAIWLCVIDGKGNPLLNTALSGAIQYQCPQYAGGDIWSTQALITNTISSPLRNLMTDKQGKVCLGRWPANSYQISLVAGATAGAPATCVVNADGSYSLHSYFVVEK